MLSISRTLGSWLARFLNQPLARYERFDTINEHALRSNLRAGDVLLVEGNTRISTAIKYLTQSTWSHAALCVGDHLGGELQLIEVDLVAGVIGVPVTKYAALNTRICRPVGLTPEDQQRLMDFVLARLGYKYDLKNVFDLLRYLLPTPPVPSSIRRRMLAFGSGDPTKAICSTLIAQAFQSVHYPILSREFSESCGNKSTAPDDMCLEVRHFSHFTPRDFDVSPYFEVVKPTLLSNFDYRRIRWAQQREMAP